MDNGKRQPEFSQEEIERHVAEFQDEVRKNTFEDVAAQLKRGGVDIESSNFIAEHGIGLNVRLKRIIDDVVKETSEDFKKGLETSMLPNVWGSYGAKFEALVRLFNEYGIDALGPLTDVPEESLLYKNIMKKLCKQLLSTEQIKEDDFDPSMLKK